jgi:1-phosphofructokinase
VTASDSGAGRLADVYPGRARLAVLAPSPILTVTVESGGGQGQEIHYHAGGQGIWVARMAAALGADVVLCVALAGEAGEVLRGLLRLPGVEVRSVNAHGQNGSYIHDRRSGTRVELARTEGRRLQRHDADELFGLILTAGLETGLAILTGPQPADLLEHEVYRRLAVDLRTNGVTVVADLSGGALQQALVGGVDLLKLSHEELIDEDFAESPDQGQLLAGIRELRRQGAQNVALSRPTEPTLALIGEGTYELAGPRFEPADPHGAGDSMLAGIGVALAEGRSMIDSLRRGMAAGALNVTRHGLGTGQPAEVERLLDHIRVTELDDASESARGQLRP